jgi:hypothetical protein
LVILSVNPAAIKLVGSTSITTASSVVGDEGEVGVVILVLVSDLLQLKVMATIKGSKYLNLLISIGAKFNTYDASVLKRFNGRSPFLKK